MTKLDMLMAREELLRQIEFVVDNELTYVHECHRADLIWKLCDKVCEQFPAQELIK